MPESPLVKKEADALVDLEALIADRVKRESETELGFRKRIDREDAEYKAAARSSPPSSRSIANRSTPSMPGRATR